MAEHAATRSKKPDYSNARLHHTTAPHTSRLHPATHNGSQTARPAEPHVPTAMQPGKSAPRSESRDIHIHLRAKRSINTHHATHEAISGVTRRGCQILRISDAAINSRAVRCCHQLPLPDAAVNSPQPTNCGQMPLISYALCRGQLRSVSSKNWSPMRTVAGASSLTGVPFSTLVSSLSRMMYVPLREP